MDPVTLTITAALVQALLASPQPSTRVEQPTSYTQALRSPAAAPADGDRFEVSAPRTTDEDPCRGVKIAHGVVAPDGSTHTCYCAQRQGLRGEYTGTTVSCY